MEVSNNKIEKAVAQAKEKIKKLRKDDSIIFPIFTDLHTLGNECEWTDKLCCALKHITQNICCDAVIDLGDNTGMLGRNKHISNGDLEKEFTDLLGKIYSSVNCPLITVNGNHDAIGTDFFKPDFWNGIVKHKFGNTSAVYDADGSYYYVDFERANTRCIVLSVPYESELYTEHPTPAWAFGKRQIEWLEKTALVFDGNVIIFIHVPFFYCDHMDRSQLHDVWNGEYAAKSYTTDLCGRIEDVESAADVINKAVAKGNIKLMGCFSGHTHLDSLWAPNEERDMDGYKHCNPLPCYQIVTMGTFLPEFAHGGFGIAIDIAVCTPSEQRIDVIRIGDGEDRSFKF